MLEAISPALRGALRSPFSEGSDLSFSIGSLFAAGEQGAWYDPSDFSTMFQDSAGTTPVTAVGQPVGRILDKSGRGNHATQTTSTSRPVLQQDGNGKYYLSFDGVDDWLVTPTITPGVDKAQVFAGVSNANTAIGLLLENAATSANGTSGSLAIYSRAAANGDYAFAANLGASYGFRQTGAAWGFPATNVISSAYDGSVAGVTNSISPRVNSVSTSLTNSGSTAVGSFSANPLYIGRRGGTTLPFNGHIYGLIVRFGANLPAGTIASTETWLNGKTGAY